MIPWIDRNGTLWPVDDPESPVGFLPGFLDRDDPRPAREQIDENYRHGGGWRPGAFLSGKLVDVDTNPVLKFPNDPPLHWIAVAGFRDEWLILFEGSLLVIVQPDKSYEIARVD